MANTTAVSGPSSGPMVGGQGGQRGRFQGDEHGVLRAQLRRVITGGHGCVEGLPGRADLQAARLHGGEVGAAGDNRHVRAAARQACRHMAADSTGAEYADFHASRSSATRDRACTPCTRQPSSGW